jgi:hypothetical protein
MNTSTLGDLAASGPEVIHRLAKALAIMNREVAGFPNVMPTKDVLRDFDTTLNQTKVDCAALTNAKGTQAGAKRLTQQALVCIADAAKTASLNGQKFLKIPTCQPPSFKTLAKAGIDDHMQTTMMGMQMRCLKMRRRANEEFI